MYYMLLRVYTAVAPPDNKTNYPLGRGWSK